MLLTLANMESQPESVPINLLVKVAGTPFAASPSTLPPQAGGEGGGLEVEPLDFVRTIAVARILMPKSAVRLSAGRENMSDEMQALCFIAGANSIFYGEKLLTTPNPETNEDLALFAKLGINAA